MPRDNPINPWRNATFADLEKACTRFAIALDGRERRSELSEGVRYLLIAIAARISTGNTVPGSPEQKLHGAAAPDLVDAFSCWYEDRREGVLRGLRMETLQRAADLALRREAARWIDPLEGALPTRPCYRGVADDAGMHACLSELAAMWIARRSP
jgi:hypothetical protein